MQEHTLRGWLARIAIGALLPGGIVASTLLVFRYGPRWLDEVEVPVLMIFGGMAFVLALPWGFIVGVALIPQAAEAIVVRTGKGIGPKLISAILNSIGGLVVGAVIWLGVGALLLLLAGLSPSAAR